MGLVKDIQKRRIKLENSDKHIYKELYLQSLCFSNVEIGWRTSLELFTLATAPKSDDDLSKGITIILVSAFC